MQTLSKTQRHQYEFDLSAPAPVDPPAFTYSPGENSYTQTPLIKLLSQVAEITRQHYDHANHEYRIPVAKAFKLADDAEAILAELQATQ